MGCLERGGVFGVDAVRKEHYRLLVSRRKCR